MWNTSSVSVVVLPSGEDGAEILALAKQWTASWLLGPAFWVLCDEIPEKSNQVPDLKAYFLGRAEDGISAQQDVGLFWALGAEEFSLIRMIAVRSRQDQEQQRVTTRKVGLLANYLDASRPGVSGKTHDSHLGTEFIKLNLVFSSTSESNTIPKSVVETSWDANILVSPEDRPTPGSFDAFVQHDEKYYGFLLAHIATAAGLWTGLPKSTYEMADTRPNTSQVRMQRVFIRAVATDKLSGELAKWALDQASSPDNEKVLGRISEKEVATVDKSLVPQKVHEIVAYLMNGVGNENFIYREWVNNLFRKEKPLSFYEKMASRIADYIDAIKYIPRFIGYSMKHSFDNDDSEVLTLDHLPRRLTLSFGPFTDDDIRFKNFQPLEPSSYQLWEHVRKTFSSAVDSPPNYPVPPALDPKTDNRLVLGDMRNVAPDPENTWEVPDLADKAGVQISDVEWLDVVGHRTQKQILDDRHEELDPIIRTAEKELAATKEELRISQEGEKQTILELSRAEQELLQDVEFANVVRANHPHGMSSETVGDPRPPINLDDGNTDGVAGKRASRSSDESGEPGNDGETGNDDDRGELA